MSRRKRAKPTAEDAAVDEEQINTEARQDDDEPMEELEDESPKRKKKRGKRLSKAEDDFNEVPPSHTKSKFKKVELEQAKKSVKEFKDDTRNE